MGATLTLVPSSVITIVLLVCALTGSASAQDLPAPAAEFAAGTLLFPDDGIVAEGAVGGTARWYVHPRISVGPEIAYVAGDRHSHLMLTGNVTFDVIEDDRRGRARIVPFAVIGGGIFRTREQFPFNETFTSTDGAFTAGGGVRTRVGDRVFVGAEARVGWELHLRLSGMVGIRFGG